MKGNEKLPAILLVGGIIILVVFSVIFFLRSGGNMGNKNVTDLIPSAPIPTEQPPYPTIPPIQNLTVQLHPRLFSPDNAQIPVGGYVVFLNTDSEPITIEAADQESQILNIGTVEAGDSKQVLFNKPGIYKYRNKENQKETGIIVIK